MTEKEWHTCDDWRPMLEFLSERLTRRKSMLYVAAGLRSIWDLLYDDSSREAVCVAERAADGAATESEIGYARWAAEVPTFGYDFDPEYIREFMSEDGYSDHIKRLLEMGIYTETDLAGNLRLGNSQTVGRLMNAAGIAEQLLYHINGNGLGEHLPGRLSREPDWPGGWLVREVFGNPYRQVAFSTDWKTETVAAIAQSIYNERAFENLPILADALEEAGCLDAELLAHCRGPGPHVLGCWALDEVRGLGAMPTALRGHV